MIPSELTVADDVVINIVRKELTSDSGITHGYFDPANKEIVIESRLDDETAFVTLIHEVCHVAEFLLMNIDEIPKVDPEDRRHEFITGLAPMLAYFMKVNNFELVQREVTFEDF